MGGFALFALLCAGAGAYYWYIHRAYSQSEVLAIIRMQVLPSVVQIGCASQDGGSEDQYGSGTYYLQDGNPMVATNAHVVLGDDGQYHGCTVYFPRPQDGSFFDSKYPTGQPVLYDTLKSFVDSAPVDGLDYALLPLEAPTSTEASYPFPPAQADAYAVLDKLCRDNGKPINIGQGLYILGYPDTGGDSLTLTQGVVSGFIGDHDEYVKISADTSHGNSGGIAISDEGCFVGIPSRATFQAGGNLGFVLASGFIRQFMDGLTGEKTYEPPTARYDVTRYQFPDFALQYPADWTVSTSTDSTGSIELTVFSSPSQGAVDHLQESLIVAFAPQAGSSDREQAIQQLDQDAATTDPNATGGDTTIDGKKVYYEYFQDNTLQTYSVPEVTNRFVLPVLPHGVYVISAIVENGPYINQFTALFTAMIDSIRFNQ